MQALFQKLQGGEWLGGEYGLVQSRAGTHRRRVQGAGLERESGEAPSALWVTSNWREKAEVHEMDPGMTMAGPKGAGGMPA